MKTSNSPHSPIRQEPAISMDKPGKSERLRREDWILAAREALIKEGITGVSLRKLATSLGATTGAFYW